MNKVFINFLSVFVVMLCMGVFTVKAQENQDSIVTVLANKAPGDLVNVAFDTQEKKDVLGAISSVDIDNLLDKNYQTYALDGIRSFVGGYTGNIWGQSPLVLVDGIPRDASNLNATEVASVTVLKGANAVVLYGSRAAKGVILITTKRGKEQALTIQTRANTGFFVPKSYPNYLDAPSYMTLYNEASDNDGIARIYSDETIYNTASGTRPYRYPDVDYFSSEFLRETYNRSDATVEVFGGDEKTQYYTNLGMSYNNDIIKYGEQGNNSDLNFRVRGNVDMQLTSWLSANADAYVRFDNNYIGRGDFWGQSSYMRPNWFTPLIPISSLDSENTALQNIIDNSNNIIDGEYLLGGNNAVQTNAFADMLAAGYIRYKSRVFQYKVSAIADLSNTIKGLSFKNTFSIDYSNYYSEAFRENYATYQPTWANMNGVDRIISLTSYGDDTNSTNEYLGDSRYEQTTSFYSQLNYERVFNEVHNITGNLIGWGYQSRNSVDSGHEGSDYHSTNNTNLGIQAAYNYADKYYVDFSGAVVHSAKLPKGNRIALSPTFTVGWRLSDENFLKNSSFINNLKITASYANLNQDIDITDYYMYQGYYDDSGWYRWRDNTMGGATVLSERGSNPNLGFVKREEYRVGLDGAFLDEKLILNVNYFNQATDGLLTQGANTIYPSYYRRWDYSYLPYINFNEDMRTGVDFSVSHNNKLGNFEYELGVVGMIYNSEAVVRDEVYQDEYQNREGKPLDASFGYISEGFFVDQADIDSHANQTFGDVLPGDLKYRDVNGDGIVDTRDQVDLGRSGSPFTYGVNLTLKYKDWTLFAMGQGQSGAIGYKNSPYFWVYGNRKYSEHVLGRWTPETANSATYPRLTTTSNTNNFRNSTFWRFDNNRFDLTKVQLTYDFPDTLFNDRSLLSEFSLYVSGQYLLTVSKEREMMEMNVGIAPQYRFYNLGLKAAF
ncbi:SusC/RagA family TonB-linked outer membrane protein [Zunongwangia atlantica]|uniref:TonB-dependent receptor plug n=1 Tax=Zunongwangia atlantica 22II14-10F7 TaxID=1185767 RepID=A0A1Y1T144_9FLAO|nr:SusC/RagA family TonB-linked outer membrane protein [Zunongwangia atlantica]ORL44751.1 TonB-dependent receptor plug [Zunongwangia atlantica 22II14-10F7]